MARLIGGKHIDDSDHNVSEDVDIIPDECPKCGHKITPDLMCAYKYTQNHGSREILQVIFKCTNSDCQRLFNTFYERNITRYYDHEIPMNFRDAFLLTYYRNPAFPEILDKISGKFREIYNQAYIAENNGLNEISGPGYRRALEFLIKDYLIRSDREHAKEIKRELLGQAIKRISDARIQALAERAAWLGNDETHYVKKFKDKDITDLKKLIQLVADHIEMEEESKPYLALKAKK